MDHDHDENSAPDSQSGRPVLVTAAIALLLIVLAVMAVIGFVLD